MKITYRGRVGTEWKDTRDDDASLGKHLYVFLTLEL